ncbi:DUF397 domain-containing protein [Streptomyces paludis]
MSFHFVKSSYSPDTTDCVEVARNVPGTVAVRDSKHQAGPILRLTPTAWRAFRAGVAAPAARLLL